MGKALQQLGQFHAAGDAVFVSLDKGCQETGDSRTDTRIGGLHLVLQKFVATVGQQTECQQTR